ncbi:MAG: hypothetical protein IJU48_03810 [Synergistaceae bacterium]|nr:hypothetical protein [Synergistaceae bacterium]
MLGFERAFTFTEANLGSKDFQALKTSMTSLPKIPGYDWVMPENGSTLTNVKVHVMASYSDSDSSIADKDVTDLMSYGLLDNGASILMSYGAIAVDRELTDNEGEIFDMVMEQTPLISDGKSDGKIAVSWYITHETGDIDPVRATVGSSGSGCEIFSPFMLLALIPLFTRKR